MNEVYCRKCKMAIKATDVYCGKCGASQRQEPFTPASLPPIATQPSPGQVFVPSTVTQPQVNARYAESVKRQPFNIAFICFICILLILLLLDRSSMMYRVSSLERQVRLLSGNMNEMDSNINELGNTVDYNAGVSNRNMRRY